jgi:acyl-CoA thioesterase I
MKLIIFFLMIVPLLSNGQSKIKVACIGNSITEGAGIVEDQRYPSVLQKLLGDKYEVTNFGVGGRTLLKKGDFSYWQDSAYLKVLRWNPEIIIIKLGTNDTKPQNWIYSEEFESNYREFIQSFKSLQGKKRIFVCTPIPVFKDGWGITGSIVSDELIPMLKRIAKAENVTLIDLYNPMLDKGHMAPDGIHPDAAGAAVIAQKIFDTLKVKLNLATNKNEEF